MRYWRTAAVVCLALLAGACGDEESPTEFGESGNLHGTWLLEDEGRSTYVRITSDQIRIYEQEDTCFTRSDYGIEAVEGLNFTLVGATSTDEWEFRLGPDGETLTIDDGVEAVTLVSSDINVESLQLCAAVVIFGNLHPSCAELPEVSVGSSVTGVLEPGDAEWGGTWYDLYALKLTAPTPVTIDLASVDGDLDMWLGIYTFDGATRVIRNDDIDYDGGNYDSRITTELGAGCWVIVANSYDGDDADEDGGNYSLSVAGDVAPEPDFEAAPCTALPQLALESSAMGLLEDADAHWSDGTYYDLYGLQIGTAGEVTIEHRAGADDVVDPYLMLYNDDATERIDENDDGAGDLDSRVVATLDPGCYIVVAASYSETPEEEGTYMVSAASGTIAPAFPHEPCVNLPLLPLGGTVNGTLEAGDPEWDGTWYDLYSVQLVDATNARISLSEDGSGIDTYLAVYDFQMGERIIRNDDIDYDGGDYNSQVETALAPGCYVVLANSYDGDDEGEVGGAYVLSLEEF